MSAATLSYVPAGNLPYGTNYWRVSPDERPGIGDPYEVPPFYRTVIISPPAPPAPGIVGPGANLLRNDNTPLFDWNPLAGTVNGGPFEYEIVISRDTGFTDIERTVNVAAATDYNPHALDALADGVYYWRVLARDTAGNWNDVGNVQQFTVNIHKLPANNTYTTDKTPALQWYAWTGAAGYRVELARDAAFTDLVTGFPVNTGGSTLSYTVPNANALAYGTYYWRVRAVNAYGVAGAWSISRNIVVNAA